MHLRQIVRYFSLTHTLRLRTGVSCELKMPTGVKKPFTVIVEGNIGSGKTTFLENFNNNPNILTLSEPVEAWKDVAGYNLLELLYSDIKSWAFTFQTYVQLTMMKLHEQETNKPVKMIERSLYSARNVFVENLLQMNLLSPPEVAVLDEWYKWLIPKIEYSVDLIVYLKTDPEVAFERIKQRSRGGENKITFKYIQNLHECHENWLQKKTKYFCPAKVLVLDANKNLQEIKEEYNYFQKQVSVLNQNQTL